jgi:hypothetical protein
MMNYAIRSLRNRTDGLTSGACPSFFRGLVQEARISRAGYYWAGHELARHAYGEAELDVTDAVLAEFDAARALPTEEGAPRLVAWMRRVFPRCMALVPRRRQNSTFLQGVADALEEGIVG